MCALKVQSVNYKLAFRTFHNSVHAFIAFIGSWMHKPYCALRVWTQNFEHIIVSLGFDCDTTVAAENKGP